jgi:orotidine-5'-phosphate decarboxylase
MPSTWILIPGYGAQGGSAQDVKLGLDTRGLGAIVNSSRGIIFAYEQTRYQTSPYQATRWTESVRKATLDMIEALS